MPPPTPEFSLTLSVLDRLIDSEPRNSSEAQLTRAQSVRQLKESLRRDLEWLLNTRRIAFPPEDALRELNRSVYVFGLPDFAGYRMSTPAEQTRLLRRLEAAVKLFEPRLANIKVVPVESGLITSRRLRLRIVGLLLIDPAPEHVEFDTVLELTSGQYEVQNAG
ncbi:MAG TPA: type VI secretion system baseplate subunit TssE [Candidatus Acidoferrales bacterium]|nr:type VI secretion system baseplate subunit TssE [Candidatus Acidoferrales bacterium]